MTEEELEYFLSIYVANIAFEKKDGSVVSSRIGENSDFLEGKEFGYIGKLLLEHYNDEKSALAISGIGDVHTLHLTIDEIVSEENRIIEARIIEERINDQFPDIPGMTLDMLDPHIPNHMKKRIDSIKKEGRLQTHDFPNILWYEKFLEPDEILGSEGNFNFLWTNDSWHYYVSKIYYEPDPSDLAVEEAEEYEELGCLVKRKWIKLSEILKPKPKIIINDDIPF